MGNKSSVSGDRSADTTHTVSVTTGDKKGAGTDGDIYMAFGDNHNMWSARKFLDTKWKDNFEAENTDIFHVNLSSLDKITDICIIRDNTKPDDDWYVECVIVESKATGEKFCFPVNRWVKAKSRLCLSEYDSSLPTDEKYPRQRAKELEEKRRVYELVEQEPGLPMQIQEMPVSESYSKPVSSSLTSTLLKMALQAKYIDMTTPKFRTLSDFKNVYNENLLPVPNGFMNWRSDEEFGNQRLNGCNPAVIQLCRGIPEKFAVTPEMVEPFLEGKSLSEAIKRKKIYLMDLTYMAAIKCINNNKLPGPYGLFYSKNNGDFMPIAIQLMPNPGEDNPVFLPSDPEYTWLAAKMWFNLADASHHQSAAHFGITHMVMETMCVCAHRQLSPSHPIFRLMAPHFLFLIAINVKTFDGLLAPGGFADQSMQVGIPGLLNIIRREFANWKITEQGNLLKDLQMRGVDDMDALPGYHYRDDALLLWHAMDKYITTVINKVYDSPEKLANDQEIQGFAKQLNLAHIKGVPESFETNSDLISVLLPFMFISSVGHASVNFNQYDEFGFPPNYPMKIEGDRPKNKTPLTEDHIVKSLSSKKDTLTIMLMTKLFSLQMTNAITDFEVQFAYDSTTLDSLKQFKTDLEQIGKVIDEREANRKRKYPYLHPRVVPNAASI